MTLWRVLLLALTTALVASGCDGSESTVFNPSATSNGTAYTFTQAPGGPNAPSPSPSPEPPLGPGRPNENGIVLVNVDESLAALGRADNLYTSHTLLSGNGRFLFLVVNELSAISQVISDPLFPDFEGYLIKFDLLTGSKKAIALTEKGNLREGSFNIAFYSKLDVTPDGRYLLLSQLDSDILEGDTLNTEPTDNPVYLLDTETDSVTPVNYTPDGVKFAVTGASVFLEGKDQILFRTEDSQIVRDYANNTMQELPVADYNESWGQGATSADGTKLVFSNTNNLTGLPNPSGYTADLPYLYDFSTGQTRLVAMRPDGSLPANGSSEESISADGKRIAFAIRQADLDPDAVGNTIDSNLYWYDVETQVTRLVDTETVPEYGGEVSIGYGPVLISPTGTHIAYVRYGYWGPTWRTYRDKLILHEIATGTEVILTDLISEPHLTTVDYVNNNPGFSFSDNGTLLSFISRRSHSHPYNAAYVYNLETGSLRDLFEENDIYRSSDIRDFTSSADGTKIVFTTNEILVAQDQEHSLEYDVSFGQYQTYFADLATNAFREISVQGDGQRYPRGQFDHVTTYTGADITDDGSIAIFATSYSLSHQDPEDSIGVTHRDPVDIFMQRTGEPGTTLVTGGLAPSEDVKSLSISGDGSTIAYSTEQFYEEPNTGIYLYDVASETHRVIRRPDRPYAEGKTLYSDLDLSLDGSVLTFIESRYEPIDSFSDVLVRRDIFRYDVEADDFANLSQAANSNSGEGGITEVSSDGRYVVFDSRASNLDSRDTNDSVDIYRYDSQTQSLEVLSLLPNGSSSDEDVIYPSMSGDGRFISFSSKDPQFVPGAPPNTRNVFVKDLQSGRLALISQPSRNDARPSSDLSQVTTDGKRVVFRSFGEGLVTGANPYSSNLFVISNPLALD